MQQKRTYTINLITQCTLETEAVNMTNTIKKALYFLRDIPCHERDNWYEIEVIDNLTELTVFKERRVK